MKPLVLCILVTGFSVLVQASGNSVEVTLEDTPERHEGLQSIPEAKARGKAQAERDIKTGRFRVYDYGRPARPNETDAVTGYLIDYLGPPGPWATRILRDQEIIAYNHTMREWYAKHKKRR
jgi:hypothetical protein